MRNQQRYPERRSSVRSAAVAPQAQSDQMLLMVIGCLVAAIIALWMAYLPTVAGSILNVLPQHLTAAPYTINSLNKGNRLALVRFGDRWSAVETSSKSQNVSVSTKRIPDGCESAFSRLVTVGNFSTRCVAAATALTRLAIAE